MPNNPNFETIEVDFGALLLDLDNPRIYAWKPQTQAEAITAMMEARGNHTCELARDIAEYGLGTPPIIVIPAQEEGKYVVMDGNRRIAAMKMLADPQKAPEKYRKKLSEAAEKFDFTLPDKISVFCFADEEVAAREIMRLHMGEQNGVGQVSWSAMEQEIFAYGHGIKPKYELATKFVIAANRLGVADIHTEKFMQKFPITTLDRLLSNERLARIGIDVSNPEAPVFLDDENAVKFRMKKILDDLLEGRVHVSAKEARDDARSIRQPEEQEQYLQEILQEDHGGKIFVPVKTDAPPAATAAPVKAASPQVRRIPSDPYDRPSLIRRGKTDKDGIRINKQAPDKLHAVYRELTKLNLKKTPMAAAILLRTFLELAVDHGIERHNISPKGQTLANKMQVCAAHLFDKNEYKQVVPLWGKDHFLTINTLHQIVHAPNFPTNNREVCMLWEQLLPLLRACLE